MFKEVVIIDYLKSAKLKLIKSAFFFALITVTTLSVGSAEISSNPSSGVAAKLSTSEEVKPKAEEAPPDQATEEKPAFQAPVPSETEIPTPDSALEEETFETDSGKVQKKKVTKIEVGDKVTVKIYPEDQYIKGATMEVSSEGTITLPLLGRINLQGLALLEAEKKITEILAKDYLVNPIVVVEAEDRIIEKKEKVKVSLSILGQVQKPGPYTFPPTGKMTLLELISKAGGFTDVANAKNIKIIRKKNDKTTAIRANAESIIGGKDPDIDLEPDDVVHVGESFF